MASSMENSIRIDGKPLPRLGQIAYINSLPITLPIARRLVPIEAETEFASPAALNLAYAADRLDLGAMSTSFFLESKAAMTLIPRLSIASDGAVGSVLFFHRKDPADVSTFKVAVPADSATSVSLLKILFGEEYGYVCDVVPQLRPDLVGDSLDGALVIGDYALSVDGAWSKRYARKDMGLWWKSKFSLPMVFGLWAARKDWVNKHPTEFHCVSETLTASLQLGLGKAMPAVIEEARERTGLSAERLNRYYREELDYSFGERHMQAICKYESLCRNYGLLTRPMAGPEFFQESLSEISHIFPASN